jgi:hypothetical protein
MTWGCVEQDGMMHRAGVALAVLVVVTGGSGAMAGGRLVARSPHALPVGFDKVSHLAPTQVHDRTAVLRWLAPRVNAGGRLVTAADTGASASASPRGAAGTLPDVNGDGIDEVFQLTFSPRQYIVRDGRTGRALWQRAAADMYDAQYAWLGSPARRALVVQTFTSSGGVDQAGVAALDARTGITMWSTTSSPTVGGSLPVAFAEVGGVLVGGLSARPHRADDVLVGSLSFAASLAGTAGALVPRIIDGADGTAGEPGTPLVADDLPSLTALPDVTGDGTPDYVLTSNGTARQTILENGATGRPVWQETSADGTSFGSYVELLPGAAAGKLGLLVEDGGFDGGSITAYAAATGTVLWTARGVGAEVIQDADHDGVPDVIVLSFGMDFGFDFEEVSGRTGKGRWHVSVQPPQGNSASSIGGGDGGDLTGDGVNDLLFTLDVAGRSPVHEQLVIDGRSGRTGRYHHLEGIPLGARLSSRGDALIDLLGHPGSVTITARDLSRSLWTQSIPLKGVNSLVFLDFGTLTRARSTDVLVSAFGAGGTYILAMDGHTGRVLWRVRV